LGFPQFEGSQYFTITYVPQSNHLEEQAADMVGDSIATQILYMKLIHVWS
jgi:hypothetical protein